MEKGMEIPPAPTVYCPKDREQVPIWYCLGSQTQGRQTCPYLVRAKVHGGESAEVECKWKLDPPLYRRGRRQITKLAPDV